MALWIVMAALAAATCLSLLVPLYRAGRPRPAENASAMAIYRDQLDELDRDVARGILAEGEAGAARTEIARRLIRAGASASATVAEPGERRRQIAAVAIVAMPILALVAYLILGSPEQPDQPLSARPEAVAREQVTALVAKVEAHLASVPDDGKGWEVVAPVYMKLGRTNDAVRAYTNAVRLLGATAEREGDLGEAIVQANNGTVTPAANDAFARAHALAPDDPRPRFYLALALGQSGKTSDAVAAWHALLDGAPADAAWVAAGRAELAKLEEPGPTTADEAAAANMTADQRVAMIGDMVAALAAKLKSDPDDADGWARLMRSYMVLNRPDDARAALADARSAVAGDAVKGAIVEAAAQELGLAEQTQ